MKDSDITDAMVDRFQNAACFELECCSYKESIAAAVNAVTPPDNDDRITPEWLDTVYRRSGMFWLSPSQDDKSKPMLRILTPASVEMFAYQSDEWGTTSITVSFETRGQLRAWHIAHRQPLVEVQS